MPTNTAAWLGAKHAKLEVKPAPYTPPREDEIVIKNHAVAINPVDWIKQVRWITYPFVLGSDLAGEVVEVGNAVTRFTVGDRVLGHAVGMDKDRNSSAEGAFQDYTVVLARMASPIPSTMAYENAAVLPLALSTAACGLFQTDHLALRHPSAMPFSSPLLPATRSSPRHHHGISPTSHSSAHARSSTTPARPSCKTSSRLSGGKRSPARWPSAQGRPSPVRTSSTPATAPRSSPWPARPSLLRLA